MKTKAEINSVSKNNKLNVEEIQLATRQKLIDELVGYRKSKKITQATISDVTGIQRPNISRLESGKYNPTLDMIVRVADSMGLTVDIVLREKSE